MEKGTTKQLLARNRMARGKIRFRDTIVTDYSNRDGIDLGCDLRNWQLATGKLDLWEFDMILVPKVLIMP